MGGLFTSTKTTSMNQNSTVDAGQAGALEQSGANATGQGLQGFLDMLKNDNGAQSQQNANGANADYAALLKQFSQSGGLPTAQDTNTANQYASQAFQGQQNSLNNSFNDQRIQAQRQAAMLNRAPNDPILAAKLAQEQTRQQGQLSADQGSFAAQFAQQLPGQRLGYAGNLAQFQTGLASQAMANRQALLSLGSQVQAQGQNYRLATADRSQNGTQETKDKASPFASILGAVTGIAGAVTGTPGFIDNLGKAGSSISGMFGGGAPSSGGGASAGTLGVSSGPNKMGAF